MTAKKEVAHAPAALSQEYVVDSSEDEETEENNEDATETTESDENDEGGATDNAGAETSAKEDDSDEDDTDRKGSNSMGKTVPKSGRDLSKGGPEKGGIAHAAVLDKRPSKKLKALPPKPMAIAAKPFIPPEGFEKITYSASAHASPDFPADRAGKQLWYFTAPGSVSIHSLKSLDIQAVRNGQPVIEHDGVSYGFVPGDRQDEVLLLPSSQGSKYSQQLVAVSKTFHLQESANFHGQRHSSTSSPSATPRFAAATPGQAKQARHQPDGLRMRFKPFGSALSVSDYTSRPKVDQPPAEFAVPEDVPSSNPEYTKSKTKKRGPGHDQISPEAADSMEGDQCLVTTPLSTAAPHIKDSGSPKASWPLSTSNIEPKERKKKKKKSRLVDEPGL